MFLVPFLVLQRTLEGALEDNFRTILKLIFLRVNHCCVFGERNGWWTGRYTHTQKGITLNQKLFAEHRNKRGYWFLEVRPFNPDEGCIDNSWKTQICNCMSCDQLNWKKGTLQELHVSHFITMIMFNVSHVFLFIFWLYTIWLMSTFQGLNPTLLEYLFQETINKTT